ncbi:MAG: hypothetical protein OXC63_13175 [Aestuariivita sp.]|nr:hypothetical protein [Aestuariivita sp.]MCY4348145.1 hypothetical protein [Aestuariivita sp.]
MTEFELANLTLREYAIWTSLGIGLGQIGIVWYGIKAMNRSSSERAKDRNDHAKALGALIRQSDASVAALREILDRPTRSAT